MAEETQRIARLTPLADVLARIDALVAPVAPRRVAAETAVGRVLAEDVVATAAVPKATLALRDGFAVASDATLDASSYAPAPLVSPQRVDVGEALPPSADAVAPLDSVVARGGRFEAIAPVTPGDGVLVAGADVGAGTVLRRAGEILRAADVAAIRAAGIVEVSVRELCIRVMPARPDTVLEAAANLIGDAIASPADGELLPPHADVELIRDVVAHMFMREKFSGDPIWEGHLAALTDPAADAVVVIGGTGAGRTDQSVRALAAAGRVEMHGVALLPGETAAFGMVEKRPVLLIPGRIDAALAIWLTLGRHLLARLSGSTQEPAMSPAVLTRKVASPLGMTEVVPVRVAGGKAEPIASGYWPLQAIAQADGWILVPADSEGYPAGAEVVVRPWP